MPNIYLNRPNMTFYRPMFLPDKGLPGGGFLRKNPSISQRAVDLRKTSILRENSISSKITKQLSGIPSNAGIAIGRALVVSSKISFDMLKEDDLTNEAKTRGLLIDEVVKERTRNLENAYAKWRSLKGERENDPVISSHLYLMDEIMPLILSKMSEEKESFVAAARQILRMSFDESTGNNMIIRTVKDIKQLLLEIYEIKNGTHVDVTDLISNSKYGNLILVADDLNPTIDFYSAQKVVGLIRERGGTTDHSSIMASAHNIVSVVHAKNATNEIKNGDIIIINTSLAEPIIISPSESMIKQARKTKKVLDMAIASAKEIKEKNVNNPINNHPIKFLLNASFLEEAQKTIDDSIDGVGLARSEYFFMRNNLGDIRESEPSIDEQIKFYNLLQSSIGKKDLYFRTIDVAAKLKDSDVVQKDKILPYFDIVVEDKDKADGLALCLDENTPLYFTFRNQLEAILRSELKSIMFPQVRSFDEVKKTFEIIESIYKELGKKGVKFNKDKNFGIMIENPLIIEDLSKIIESGKISFFSIGTNDLTMAITGISRYAQSEQTYYEQQFNPSVRSAIKRVKQIADEKEIPISICGDIVNDWRGFLMLLALGINRFSFSNSTNAAIARKIAYSVDKQSLEDLSKLLDQITSPMQIIETIESFAFDKIEKGIWDLKDILPYLKTAVAKHSN